MFDTLFVAIIAYIYHMWHITKPAYTSLQNNLQGHKLDL